MCGCCTWTHLTLTLSLDNQEMNGWMTSKNEKSKGACATMIIKGSDDRNDGKSKVEQEKSLSCSFFCPNTFACLCHFTLVRSANDNQQITNQQTNKQQHTTKQQKRRLQGRIWVPLVLLTIIIVEVLVLLRFFQGKQRENNKGKKIEWSKKWRTNERW